MGIENPIYLIYNNINNLKEFNMNTNDLTAQILDEWGKLTQPQKEAILYELLSLSERNRSSNSLFSSSVDSSNQTITDLSTSVAV